MRQVVLDTETTGLDPGQGHRVIEIGCVEVVDRRLTGRVFHRYLNPDREIDGGAVEVHGITSEFLADKPRFADVVAELIEFLQGAEVLIHNAGFDVDFINRELAMADPGLGGIEAYCTVTDTLALARQKHPGKKNSLDALCRQYAVDNSRRELHGALLDAQLLAEVYLAMTGGQVALAFATGASVSPGSRPVQPTPCAPRRPTPVLRATPEECAAHETRLSDLERASSGRCLWRELAW
jgi:DNA polymerase-3 subunit epsilon